MNIAMKKINIILAALMMVFLSSCNGFLDVRPSNYTDSDYSIKNAEDANYMIHGLMRKMTSSNYYGRNFLIYGDAKGGDVTTFSAGNGGDGWYYFTHRPNSNSYIGYWSTIYDCILQANDIITKCEALQKEDVSGLDSYIAQAKTLRAIFHFDLVRLYGKPYNMDGGAGLGVPVVTSVLGPYEQPTRNTVKEVYAQVVKDLTESGSNLSKSPSNTKGFVNYYVNQAYLAKVYMYMDKYAEALSIYEGIIDSDKYSLYSADKWVESWMRQYGTESIFELEITEKNDLGSNALGAYYRRRGHGISGGGVFLAGDSWLSIMGEKDVRKGIMGEDQASEEAREEKAEAEEEGETVDDDVLALIGRRGACYKHSGSPSLDGDGKGNSSAVNVKVIRLSEIYLNAAECAVRTGDQTKAKDYLTPIAQRNPDWVAPATITAEDVQTERRRELHTEGVLFFEYMRQGMTVKYDDDQFGNGTNPPTSGRGSLENGWVTRDWFKTILPIGQDELNANPKLKDQQNPGY